MDYWNACVITGEKHRHFRGGVGGRERRRWGVRGDVHEETEGDGHGRNQIEWGRTKIVTNYLKGRHDDVKTRGPS